MKLFLIFLSIACCSGCATHMTPASIQTKIPPGSEALLDKAYRLIDAYQQNDSKTWSELVCMASTNEKVFGLSAVKFFGEISSPRLVSVSSVSEAGNSMRRYQWPEVAIEVHAEGYPVGNLLLKFMEDEDQKCVGVIY